MFHLRGIDGQLILGQDTLTTCYPTRTCCRATEVTNARTGGLTYEMATCETAPSRTITLTANGRKIPQPD